MLSLYRDFGFAGLIAQDSEFALCNVPAYFSSHALKLSWNGKNLTTHQYLLSEAARQLGLKTQHLPCFAALLGEGQRTNSARLTHLHLRAVLLLVCVWSFERVSLVQEIIFCLMRTWLPSTGVCWDQNTHLLLSRYSMFLTSEFFVIMMIQLKMNRSRRSPGRRHLDAVAALREFMFLGCLSFSERSISVLMEPHHCLT